jgi:hypothetical protein
MTKMTHRQPVQCAHCAYFTNEPHVLEQQIGGLRVMGSGHSSVVSNDGLCQRLDRYLSGNYWCDHFRDRLQGRVEL